MNITLNKDEVMVAITVYLAIKGMKPKNGNFEFNWNKIVGLKNIVAKDVEYINGEIDANKLVELVRNYN